MGRSGPIRFRSMQRSAIPPFPLQATSVGQNSGSQAAIVGPILARFPTKRRPNPGPIELPELGILTCPARHRDHEDGPGIPAACLALSLRRRGRSAPRGYLHGIIFGRPGISVSCPGITQHLTRTYITRTQFQKQQSITNHQILYLQHNAQENETPFLTESRVSTQEDEVRQGPTGWPCLKNASNARAQSHMWIVRVANEQQRRRMQSIDLEGLDDPQSAGNYIARSYYEALSSIV